MQRNRKLLGPAFARCASLALVKLLPYMGNRRRLKWGLVTFSSIARAIPNLQYQQVQLDQLREAFQNDHPALSLAERIITHSHPKFLTGIIRNLWMPFWENGFIREEFLEREGFEPPLLAVISPLKECNLQCKGCYASAVTTKEDRLDFDAMDKIVTELKSFGTPFIVISGGEPTHPLMWPTVKALCAKHHEQAFMMYTNGTLIDDAKVNDLLELGNLTPAISVEGWKEQTDARRGDGVYDRIMAAMDRLREARVFFGFSLTYTSQNFESATDTKLIDFLMEKGCLYGWYFMYVPVGKDPDMSLVVSPSQRDGIREFTWDMLRQKGLFIADFWNSGAMTMGCIAGGRYLHINNKGNIEPCVFFKFTTNNIRDTRLIDALRSPLFSEIRRGQEGQSNPLTPCQFMDHPEDGRRAVTVSGARPSEEGGDSIFGPQIYPAIERWSAEYREQYATPAWQSGEYEWFGHVYSEPRWTPPGKRNGQQTESREDHQPADGGS